MADRDKQKDPKIKRRELVKGLIAEANRKLKGGYSKFSEEFGPDYVRLGPQFASLDASVTLRAVSCMEPERARAYVGQKQSLKVNGAPVELAYLEMALNAVSHMTTEEAREFVANHPIDLEVISDEDYNFRKGVPKPSLGDDSSLELAELLIVAMRHKDLSMDVGRKWIRNGLSLPGHSLDVSEGMGTIASEYLGLDEKEAAKYRFFGLLHDLGKLYVNSGVLGSEKELDEKGWASMRQHPSRGQEIIKALSRYARTEYSKEVLEEAGEITRLHHENFDGSGYPDGINGEDIPLPARILRIVDFFKARTAHRSYSSSMPPEVAAHEGRRCSGQSYDEKILRAYQEEKDPRYTRWQRGSEMEFDPVICRGGEVFEVLAKAKRRVA